MLKRVSDTIRSMLISDTGYHIETLTAMGFDETRARHALAATSGNLDQATEILLIEQGDEQYPNENVENAAALEPSSNHARTLAGKAAMERLQKNSLKQNSSKHQASNGKVSNQRTKLSSFKTTVVENNHDLQLPTPIRHLTKQEQILRCTQRLAPHSLAVDALLKLFKNIRDYPQKEVYKTLYKSNPEYQRVLKDKPGVEDLLQAVNFYPTNHNGSEAFILARTMVDPALLFLGISALEQVRENSEDYKASKAQLAFVKEMQSLLEIADGSAIEALKRAEYLSKCPTESSSSGVLLQIHLGTDQTISRKFDSDDTLSNVIHWLGAHSSALPQKLASRDWCLVSLNSYPVEPIDTVQAADKTLQSIGCFPSARLEVRPSPLSWRQDQTNPTLSTTWSTDRALAI